MLMSRESHKYMSAQVRLQSAVLWDVLTFVLNGVVFILIDLQLPFVLKQLSPIGIGDLIRMGAIFCISVILLRLLWIFGETYAAYWYGRWRHHSDIPTPQPKELIVLTWGGMRGVLSLAAAFSVPYTLANGMPLKQRSMIIFLTFCVIGTSLVFQGLSMPWLIRLLAIDGSNEEEREERRARRTLVEEAIRYLNRRRLIESFDPSVIHELLSGYERRLRDLPMEEIEQGRGFSRQQRDALLLKVVQVERESLLRLRDEGAISDDVARSIQRDLDLMESHIHTGSTQNALIAFLRFFRSGVVYLEIAVQA
jgi:monovalent cation/hydrogen antiporter